MTYGHPARTRLCVVGTSGSGKSTLARAIAARLALSAIELDGLYHQADWRPAAREDFRTALLDALATADASYGGWVVDGNYSSAAGDLLAVRVETWVWLDYPRRVVMARVLRRTVDRMLFRRVLWNGNRESWRNLFRRDAQVNILLWAWTTHASNRERLSAASAVSETPWVRLRSPAETGRWLASLATSARAAPAEVLARQRFCIVGSSGVGKSRLASRLAEQRQLTHIEADAFYHRPGWQRAPYEEFVAEVRAALAAADRGWVIDSSFADVAGEVETFVWWTTRAGWLWHG